MGKKILRFYIVNRLAIAIALLLGGLVFEFYIDMVVAIIMYILAAISFLLYFMIGTMRLVQESVQEGNVEEAMYFLNKIKYPKLLFKPVRVGYYMLQSNLALSTNDLGKAEAHIQKSLKTKSKIAGDTEGTSLMQLGFIQLKKGNLKEGRETLLQAIKVGVPDKEALAGIYLQLCSIEIHRKQNKVAKEHYRKAKALKPKTEELVNQIKLLDKQISRLPG